MSESQPWKYCSNLLTPQYIVWCCECVYNSFLCVQTYLKEIVFLLWFSWWWEAVLHICGSCLVEQTNKEMEKNIPWIRVFFFPWFTSLSPLLAPCTFPQFLFLILALFCFLCFSRQALLVGGTVELFMWGNVYPCCKQLWLFNNSYSIFHEKKEQVKRILCSCELCCLWCSSSFCCGICIWSVFALNRIHNSCLIFFFFF